MLSGASISSRSGGLHYAPFTLDVYLQDYKDYLEISRFDVMPLNGDAEMSYGARFGLDCDSALDAWSRRWTHWDGCRTVLRSNDI